MGKGRGVRFRLISGDRAAVILLGGLFLLGGVLGCLAARCVEGESGTALQEYLRAYLAMSRENGTVLSAAGILWERFRFPLCILLMSFTAFGIVCIPAVLLLRGFLFSFSIACFIRLFGWKGLLPAAALFGFSALVWLPALFEMSVLGLEQSYRLVQRCTGEKKEGMLQPSGGLMSWGICLAAMILSAGLEYFVVPRLVNALSHVLV